MIPVNFDHEPSITSICLRLDTKTFTTLLQCLHSDYSSDSTLAGGKHGSKHNQPVDIARRFRIRAGESPSGVSESLLCSGQTSVDDDGAPVNPGDMGAQVMKALDNLETVLIGAGFTLSDVVRLNYS